MKAVLVILIFVLANTLFQCAKPALNAFAENPTLYTKGLGYFPLVAILTIALVAGKKYFAK